MPKTGKRPDGSAVALMPFEALEGPSDVDLEALLLYLGTAPVVRPRMRATVTD